MDHPRCLHRRRQGIASLRAWRLVYYDRQSNMAWVDEVRGIAVVEDLPGAEPNQRCRERHQPNEPPSPSHDASLRNTPAMASDSIGLTKDERILIKAATSDWSPVSPSVNMGEI
jgi:hypothetical protein